MGGVMELRTLARMTFDLTYAYLILSAGMLRDAVVFRVERAARSCWFCPCSAYQDDAPEMMA
jgi:hypothetical protein